MTNTPNTSTANTSTQHTFVAAARACLGTPFVPQGRHRSAGLDCAGLVLVAAAACGVTLVDNIRYSMPPAPHDLLAGLQQPALQPAALLQAGTIMLLRVGGQAQHLAIASTPDTMIHAYAPAQRVVETAIGSAWHSRLLGLYQLLLPKE